VRARRLVGVQRGLDGWRVAKPIGVVAVLVAGLDLIDALAKLLATVMAPTLGVAVIFEQRGEPVREANTVVDLPQQQDAAVGGDVGRVAAQQEWLALELNRDRCNTVCRRHGCLLEGLPTRGTLVPASEIPVERTRNPTTRDLFRRSASSRTARGHTHASAPSQWCRPGSRIIQASRSMERGRSGSH